MDLKTTFVEYYWSFKDSSVSYDEILKQLLSRYKLASSYTKRREGKNIFKAGLQIQALERVISSSKLQNKNPEIVKMAKDILTKELQK